MSLSQVNSCGSANDLASCAESSIYIVHQFLPAGADGGQEWDDTNSEIESRILATFRDRQKALEFARNYVTMFNEAALANSVECYQRQRTKEPVEHTEGLIATISSHVGAKKEFLVPWTHRRTIRVSEHILHDALPTVHVRPAPGVDNDDDAAEDADAASDDRGADDSDIEDESSESDFYECLTREELMCRERSRDREIDDAERAFLDQIDDIPQDEIVLLRNDCYKTLDLVVADITQGALTCADFTTNVWRHAGTTPMAGDLMMM